MVTVLPLSEHNLILTGYTGPNQPSIAREVAERLKMPFINIELQIENRFGMAQEDIQARFGESYLKNVESEIMQEAVLHRNAVIRVSGRTLLYGNHLSRLRENGTVICLVAALDAVLQRLHLALGGRFHDPNERALALGHLRSEWAVRRLPGVHELDTTYLSEAETIDRVISMRQALAVSRG